LDEIWNTEYIFRGWSWQILSTIRAVATAGEPGEFLFFLSGKQRTISPISRRPYFTKFAYNASIGKAVIPFGTEFRKFYREGSFSKKREIFAKKSTACNFRPP